MTDLGKYRDSFQTPWNASSVLANRFPTTIGIGREDLWWILKGPKSAHFEQKAWGYTIAHGVEYADLGECWISFQTSCVLGLVQAVQLIMTMKVYLYIYKSASVKKPNEVSGMPSVST